MSAVQSQQKSTWFSRHPWLPLYLVLLVVLIIWGALVFNLTPNDYQAENLESDSWFARVTEPWNHWDTPYYLQIAESWYQPSSPEVSFPPIYSILVGALGRVLGGAYLPAALIISWGALAAVCGLLYQEFQEYTDHSSSLRAVKYLLIFPTAFFLFAGYSESLFLVFLLLSWRGGKKGIWWQASLFGVLATMTRFIGIFLAFPFAWMWFKAPTREKVKIAAWLSPIPIVYFSWTWLAESFFNITPSQAVMKFWSLKTDWPWVGLIGSIKKLVEDPRFFGNYGYVDVVSVFLFGAAIFWAVRKKFFPEALFMAALLIAFLVKIVETDQLYSLSRYVLVLYPGFLMLAEWGKRKWFDILWTTVSVLYLFHLSIFFFIGK